MLSNTEFNTFQIGSYVFYQNQFDKILALIGEGVVSTGQIIFGLVP